MWFANIVNQIPKIGPYLGSLTNSLTKSVFAGLISYLS